MQNINAFDRASNPAIVKLLGEPCKQLRDMMEQSVLVIQHFELGDEYIFEGVATNMDGLDEFEDCAALYQSTSETTPLIQFASFSQASVVLSDHGMNVPHEVYAFLPDFTFTSASAITKTRNALKQLKSIMCSEKNKLGFSTLLPPINKKRTSATTVAGNTKPSIPNTVCLTYSEITVGTFGKILAALTSEEVNEYYRLTPQSTF